MGVTPGWNEVPCGNCNRRTAGQQLVEVTRTPSSQQMPIVGDPRCPNQYATCPSIKWRSSLASSGGSEMQYGKCKLCEIDGELHKGHIEPSFGYKRYITGKGGRYFDSTKDRYQTRQYTSFMFCRHCENVRLGTLDGIGANFLKEFESAPSAPHFLEERFLAWATSLSFRVLLHHVAQNPCDEEQVTDVLEQWKRFLLGREQSVGRFTQHAFVQVSDEGPPFQRQLDWKYLPEVSLTYCQIGPLVVFGVTRNGIWTKQDKMAAEASMINKDGTYIQRFTEFETGVNIRSDMLRVLRQRGVEVLKGVMTSKARENEVKQLSEWQRLEIAVAIGEHRPHL